MFEHTTIVLNKDERYNKTCLTLSVCFFFLNKPYYRCVLQVHAQLWVENLFFLFDREVTITPLVYILYGCNGSLKYNLELFLTDL